jgi:hypothetical protein
VTDVTGLIVVLALSCCRGDGLPVVLMVIVNEGTVVTLGTTLCCGVTEAVSAGATMEVKIDTLLEAGGEQTTVGYRFTGESGKVEVAGMKRVVVSTIVGMMVITVMAADGKGVAM